MIPPADTIAGEDLSEVLNDGGIECLDTKEKLVWTILLKAMFGIAEASASPFLLELFDVSVIITIDDGRKWSDVDVDLAQR